MNRGRIGTLAGKKQRTQAGEITIPRELARGILSLDRADRSRRGEQSADPILFDDAPERSRIGGAHGFSFVENGRVAVQERAVNDIRMAHDPSHIRCGPIGLARCDAIEVPHRPLECNGMTPVVAHDALRLPGRTRGVENVEWIGREDRYARHCLSSR